MNNINFEVQVPVVNIESLRYKVETLNKRAVKLGVPTLVLIVGTDITYIEKTITKLDDVGEVIDTFKRNVEYVGVNLFGEVPVIDGWAFAGLIDKSEGLNIVSGEVPFELRDANPRHCDHCHTNRDRNKIIVVRNIESGEYKRVGTSCVADFLPNANVDTLLNAAKFYDDVIQLKDECGGFNDIEYQERAANVVCTEDWIAVVGYTIHKHGWISATKAKEEFDYCTAELAMEFINKQENNFNSLNALYGGFYDKAREVIERIKNLSDDTVLGNNYLANLREILREVYIPIKYVNIAASVYAAIENMDRKEFDETELRANAAKSEYVGTIKKREDFNVNVVNVFSFDGYYGMTYINTMVDENGNSIVWKSSNRVLVKGDVLKIKGTVKEHKIYESNYGDVKTTYITRCKVVEVTETTDWELHFGNITSDKQQDDFFAIRTFLWFLARYTLFVR